MSKPKTQTAKHSAPRARRGSPTAKSSQASSRASGSSGRSTTKAKASKESGTAKNAKKKSVRARTPSKSEVSTTSASHVQETVMTQARNDTQDAPKAQDASKARGRGAKGSGSAAKTRRTRAKDAAQVVAKSHAELDALLDELAADPETFTEKARALAKTWNEEGYELEISDPASWRRSVTYSHDAPRSVEDQLRDEVDRILLLDREPEAQLARRVEFARLRLDLALEAAGLDDEDLEGRVSSTPAPGAPTGMLECSLPGDVCRRWVELHSLRTEMVERNLYLVLINVERYSHTRGGRLDLIQEGASGLFRAVDGFDWRRGLLFRTYAVHWLNQAFRSHLYNFGNTVRVPVYLQKAMKHVHDAIEKIGDPNASVEAIAEVSGLGDRLVAAALKASKSTYSMDIGLGSDDGDGPSLRDSLSPDDDFSDPYTTDLEDTTLEQGLDEAMGKLSDRERYVVSLRYGVGVDHEHTLAEVAEKLGVSLERVRQIQVRALAKMDTPHLRRAVDPFLS